MNIKVAFLGHRKMPSREGGVEVVVYELSSRLAALGYKITCFNRKYKNQQKHNPCLISGCNGVKIEEVFTIDIKGIAAVTSSFFACLKACFDGYDIIHFHAEGPAFFCFIPRIFGKKVVVTIHGLNWKTRKWNKFASWFIKKGEQNAVKFADEIIVLNKCQEKYFLDTYNKKTIYIPNGIDRNEYKSPREIKKWGLNKNDYVLYLGRIVPGKGIEYLINAWKQIDTNKKLVIAGKTSDTKKYGDKLISYAFNDDRIIFTGFVQGEVLQELYSNCYTFCLPSEAEGMPISLLEAMSYGNCCLVSNISECVEVIEDKAVVFESANIEDLKSKLIYLLKNCDIVEKYKGDSKDFICKKYNWDFTTRETDKLYRKILESKKTF